MPNLVAALDSWIDQLGAAGIAATADMRSLNPPGVFLQPPGLSARFKGGWDADFVALAVVPNVGTAEALAMLGDLVERVQTALNGYIVTAEPVDLQTNDGAAPMPAYRLIWSAKIH